MPTPIEQPPSIAPHHLQRLARSGVSPAVLTARRYETAVTKAAVEKLGFSRVQCNPPALVIPMYDAAGNRVGVQIRPEPAGSQADIERANREANRVFRAQGNQAGRGWCTRDGTPREGRSPQCLPVSTGEDVPEGHSLNSRLLALEVRPGDVLEPSKYQTLSRLLKLGRQGLVAGVMASFLTWLAPRYDEERKNLHGQREEFRGVFREKGRLPRAVDIAADLLAGFEVFLDFCLEQGAITEGNLDSLWEAMHHALNEVLEEQTQTTEEADPVSRYLSLLVTALTTGYAHLKDRSNKVPLRSPTLWGWKEMADWVAGADDDSDSEQICKTGYAPQGAQIGWVSDHQVFLEIEASLIVVQTLARDSSLRPLPLTKRSLGKALQARGLLRKGIRDSVDQAPPDRERDRRRGVKAAPDGAFDL
jgi:hypothetical protein